MPFPDFNPIALAIPTPWFVIPIRWYALGYIFGILFGWRYAVALTRNSRIWGPGGAAPISAPQIDDLILWVTLGIIGGGRLGYIVFYSTATLWTNPLQIFRTWEGGMSFHGGLIGVSIAVIGFALRHRISLLRLGDFVAPCAPVGLGLVRVANFVNGELWGRPTSLPWGIVFPNAGLLPRHPSQLYEAALEGLVLFAIIRLCTHGLKLLNRPGAVAATFLTFYGLFRFAVEHVREPDAGMPDFPLGLSMGMILSLPMILVGLGLLAYALSRPPVAAPAPEAVDAAAVDP